MPKTPDTFAAHVRKLGRALATLEGTADRPIARRNARKRVLQALRAVRGAVDEQFPAIVSRAGVKRLDPETRAKRLKRAGWVPVPPNVAATFAAAGAPLRDLGEGGVYYLPRWAMAVGANRAKLQAARKSLVIRNAAVATMVLNTTA